MPRSPKPLDANVMRAAKLSRVPGVTIAEACARFDVPRSAVERARRNKSPGTELSVAELALAALTNNGTEARGDLSNLGKIAGWVGYVNRESCDVEGVRRLLESFVTSGRLSIAGDQWTLLKPWP